MQNKLFVLNHLFVRAMSVVLLGALLGACSQPAPPAQKQMAKPDHDPVDDIRAVGDKFVSDLEVHPLHNPAVDGLMQQAHSQEIQRNFDKAIALTQQALLLAPSSPDIIQYEAELEIQRQHYADAATLAQQSYDHGPKVGSLCARNLQTLVEARAAQNDPDGAAKVKALLPSCRVDRPARM